MIGWFKNREGRGVLVILGLGLLLRLWLSIQIYSGDVNNHIAWGKDSVDYGFAGIYEREFTVRYGTLSPTYPPIPIFIFTASYWFYKEVSSLAWKANLVSRFFPSNVISFLEDQDTLPAFTKVWAVGADLAAGLIVYLVAKKLFGKRSGMLPLIVLGLVIFNPAFFYNSAYWGQIEAIPIAFLLAGLYSLYYSRRDWFSGLCLGLALVSKQTSIVFVPLFLCAIYFRCGVRGLLRNVGVMTVVLWFSFLPFYESGGFLAFPFQTYARIIRTGSGSDFVTDHAFNYWALVTGLEKIPDKTNWNGVAYSWWGLMFFGIIYLGIIAVFAKGKKSVSELSFASALVIFGAFLFLTKMHERYLQPVLPFLLISSVRWRAGLAVFAYLSAFYFFNLYHNWWAPRWPAVVKWLSSWTTISWLIYCALFLFVMILLNYVKNRSTIFEDSR